MKNRYWLPGLLALTALFFVPIKAEAQTPDKSVKNFYVAMSKGEFAVARKYIQTKELADLVQMLEELAKQVPELKAESGKEFVSYAAGKAVSVKVSGSNATVVWSYIDPKSKKKTTTSHKLKKVSGVWKIIE